MNRHERERHELATRLEQLRRQQLRATRSGEAAGVLQSGETVARPGPESLRLAADAEHQQPRARDEGQPHGSPVGSKDGTPDRSPLWLVPEAGAGTSPWRAVRADEPLAVDPMTVSTAGSGDADMDEAEYRDWSAAIGEHYAVHDSPTPEELGERRQRARACELVEVDAVIGARLTRHATTDLLATVEHLAGLRADADVMLVNLITELSCAKPTLPAGFG